MNRVVILMLVLGMFGAWPGAFTQSPCASGAASAEQQARRRDGVRIARLVNTAQANQPGASTRKYLRQEDLARSEYVQKRRQAQDAFAASLNFTPGEEVLPGWELKLDVTAEGYWFIVKDKTDACGFAFVSNQNGLIYTAEPLR